MKLLRLVIFFVLTFALPTLGLAAVGTPSPCQMTMGMAQMDCASNSHADQDAKFKQHGACKMDAACKACDVYRPSIAEDSIKHIAVSRIVLAQFTSPVFSHHPDGLWRPPRQL